MLILPANSGFRDKMKSMLLESLEAQNFRNLNGQIVCGKNLNIIFGENGQGKTNWLEAIYLLATTKSFKTARLQEAIKFEEELAIVRGNVHQGEHIDRLIQVALQGNTKTLTVNGKKEPLTRFLGELHAIIFNSDELEIVRGIAGCAPKIPRRRNRFDLPAVRADFDGLQPRDSTEKFASAIGA